MKMAGSFFLVGPMGAGKSTVGRRLAQALRQQFIDCDKELERRTGASIPLIFELEGEAGFRAREKALVDELTQRPNIVLATGGGVVLDPDNRRCLAERGYVIYLQTSVDEQLRRIGKDPNRPLLQTDDPHAKLASILALRAPLYCEVADLIVGTDGCNARQLTSRIIHCLPKTVSCYTQDDL